MTNFCCTRNRYNQRLGGRSRVHFPNTPPSKFSERIPAGASLNNDQLKALRALLERDGVPIAEQIRRGVDLWLEKRKK